VTFAAGRITRPVTGSGVSPNDSSIQDASGEAARPSYGAMVAGIREVVVHSDAVCEFSYDWRLPVGYNVTLLEQAARAHLKAWRAHGEYARFRKDLPETRPAQLVLVAHSMGGLLVQALPEDLDIRATVTLGTPFDGSAKAAMILNTGRGAPLPLPRERLRLMARSMPGLHDLLPTYLCLDDVEHDTDPMALTPRDVEELGGDVKLAEKSFSWHKQMSKKRLRGHHALVGIKQPTVSSLTLRSGLLEGHLYTFEPTVAGLARDGNGILVRQLRHGDGTVPYNSALPDSVQAVPLAQQHGPIARAKEAIDMVRTVICQGDVHAPRLAIVRSASTSPIWRKQAPSSLRPSGV
jgi:Lecithin:cholesterol acyltransferase